MTSVHVQRQSVTQLSIYFPNLRQEPKKDLKSFPSHKCPLGGADLRFNSPQPDTSRSCKSTDMGLVCRMGCLFKFPACTGTNLLLGEQRQCVNNLPKVEREAPWPGIEPVTSWLQVCNTLPRHTSTHKENTIPVYQLPILLLILQTITTRPMLNSC